MFKNLFVAKLYQFFFKMRLFLMHFKDYPAHAGVNADDFSMEYSESFLDEQIGHVEIQSVLVKRI
jgi:hypothetical protein